MESVIVCTTGGPESSYKEEGFNGDIDKILFHINHGMLYFIGMDVVPPFISYGPARADEENRKETMDNYRKHLDNMEIYKPLY